MGKIICTLTTVLLLCGTGVVFSQMEPMESGEFGSTLTVQGRGEVSVAPDQGFVRLGAIAQAPKAAEAQERINHIVQGVLKGIKDLGVPEEKITTVELFISPVYGERQAGPPERPGEPVILGYRAGSVLRIQVDDLTLLGNVIDTGLGAGANRMEGVSFSLKDDREARKQALRLAAKEAKSKAETITRAMGMRLLGVRTISEGGVSLTRPEMDFSPTFSAAYKATPVQSGRIKVEASLTVTYDIEEAEAPAASDGVVTSAFRPM